MKIKRLLFLFSLPLLLAACTSYKNVPYLQNPEAVNDLEGTLPLYDAKIMPKDLLSITVNTTDPQAAAPFNLTVQTPLNAALTNINTTTQPTLQQYLVNNSGEIDFPVIGTLRVGGLTKNEAESLIRERLRPYLKEAPIVTVRMANYKISVLGEVARPGSFTIGEIFGANPIALGPYYPDQLDSYFAFDIGDKIIGAAKSGLAAGFTFAVASSVSASERSGSSTTDSVASDTRRSSCGSRSPVLRENRLDQAPPASTTA